MASRIGLRMQLMREQAQQDEQRERMHQQHFQHHQLMPSNASPAISTPASFQPPPPVPVEVLQVQTHLENPTTYHLQQSRDKKVRDYLSDTYGNKFAAHLSPHRLSPKPPPAPPSPANRTTLLSSSAGNSAPNSPMARMNLCSNPEREMDDVLDSIISLDDMYGCTEPALSMPNTLPFSSSHLGLYSDSPRISDTIVGITSNSCPADLPIKRELSDAENRALVRERQKKDTHNMIERRRRFNINDRIKELGTLIPKTNDLETRWNKGTILRASVDYIKHMQKEQHRSRDLEVHSKHLQQANKQLWLRIQELELQAQAHGLSSTSPHGVNHTDAAKHEPDPMTGVQQQQLGVPQQTTYQHVVDFSAGVGYQNSACADTSFPAISKSELDLMLLEDTMLSSDPMMTCDPLMSTLSPGTSKASSRRSSFSIDEVDGL
ncbi:PREDICTED: transcription factor EB [Nanorana parkeri]|uniref:transcription factor EB n=1 Tax=Nanorana parkeri TaxID=125878 RepID=UPI00085473E3|nr:PREDICTED: transcription factor EB [Nanorana parkeri]XP_018432285.1 PREDICTED: transcription factor EB [Nanorana parkeri]